MKMLIKSTKGSVNIPPLLNIIDDEEIGEVAHEDEENCNLLNKCFCSISKLDEENVKLPEFTIKRENKLQNVEINLEEIIDVIKIMDPNKASGPDVISHKMLKICPEGIAIPLKIIFN